VMELCDRALPLTHSVAVKGNVNSISDAGVAAAMLQAASAGAALNVRINLGTIQDDAFVHDISVKTDSLLSSADQRSNEVQGHIRAALS
ncbi:MAG: cyclodeaminase/cyclohydrolase family protein, partial [Bacteroidota bacterium]